MKHIMAVSPKLGQFPSWKSDIRIQQDIIFGISRFNRILGYILYCYQTLVKVILHEILNFSRYDKQIEIWKGPSAS